MVLASKLQAPFPWFGGKSFVVDPVWERFGQVQNYVEPFFGSGAMLLGSPVDDDRTETINDLDGMVANFWRAIHAAPDEVAEWADWPVNESDLHPRHCWLVEQKANLSERLMGDPEYYDTKIAGWWVWGICSWIGSGWCSGNGPWVRECVDGKWQLVHLGNKGRGVKRQLVHLNRGRGVDRKRVHLGDKGRGVNRKRVHLSRGQGVNRKRVGLFEWFSALSDRLRRVRVCCGDWSRVCGPTPTVKMGTTAVFLDPPYSEEVGRRSELYSEENMTVAHEVRRWALEWGSDKRMRIALCGYEGEHDMPGWECFEWKAHGGYGSEAKEESEAIGRNNSKRERIWFSPNCLSSRQARLL